MWSPLFRQWSEECKQANFQICGFQIVYPSIFQKYFYVHFNGPTCLTCCKCSLALIRAILYSREKQKESILFPKNKQYEPPKAPDHDQFDSIYINVQLELTNFSMPVTIFRATLWPKYIPHFFFQTWQTRYTLGTGFNRQREHEMTMYLLINCEAGESCI